MRLAARWRHLLAIALDPTSGLVERLRCRVLLICFEDVFPHIARKSVQADTDFLVNITNDGWFGEGAAQWQQAAAATFRTIENGVPLIRCANTGITCWIDAHGRWRQIYADKTGSVYGVGFMLGTIPLPDKHPPTYYNQHGDVFGWACVGFTLMILITEKLRGSSSLNSQNRSLDSATNK